MGGTGRLEGKLDIYLPPLSSLGGDVWHFFHHSVPVPVGLSLPPWSQLLLSLLCYGFKAHGSPQFWSSGHTTYSLWSLALGVTAAPADSDI